MVKLLRLGNTEFNLVLANFCSKYLNHNNTLDNQIINTRAAYIDWIYKTAGYYDKAVAIKDRYTLIDLTTKLDLFIDNIGNILHNFDDVCMLGLDSILKTNSAYQPYIKSFEQHYNIKLHPYNIDARTAIKYIQNKRVLVVSSFKDLIDQQIQSGNLNKLQPLLQSSSFITYKFPYTFLNNGPHQDSLETLDYVTQDILKYQNSFDIAILACGCYGSIITDTICHRMNKEAIYIGGQLPLIFGIIGKRDKWAIHELYKNHLDAIIDGIPQQYRPDGYEKIEGGCYW